jgi:spoIIIJ-associated protein
MKEKAMADARLEKIKTLLTQLTFTEAEITQEEADDRVQVNITLPESDSGALIGYHGEKIDALQLIINVMWNQNAVVYTPVSVDINGYRARRHQTLEDLADKAATKAVESGREILLPHLPSYERRIIHVYLESRGDVTTYSEGEGDERRLVVRPNIQNAE